MMHRFSIAQGGEHELLFSAILVVMFSIYVFQAQRIVYDASVHGAAIRTIALTLSIGPMLFAFKFVLFLATLYWIK